MDTKSYRLLQSERGRRGGLRAAASRRSSRAARERALDAQWPRCPECGERTHLGACPRCDG